MIHKKEKLQSAFGTVRIAKISLNILLCELTAWRYLFALAFAKKFFIFYNFKIKLFYNSSTYNYKHKFIVNLLSKLCISKSNFICSYNQA